MGGARGAGRGLGVRDLDSSQEHVGASLFEGNVDLFRLYKNSIRLEQSCQPRSAFLGHGHARAVVAVGACSSLGWPGSNLSWLMASARNW